LTFLPKIDDESVVIGNVLSSDALSKYFNLQLSREPVELTENLIFLGEIERTNDFEAENPIGQIFDNGVKKDDYLLDDTALVYKSVNGLVVITGCSHPGICNIVDAAKKICGDDRVISVIGGFHLLNPSLAQLQGTLNYMDKLRPESIYACHCTDLKSKIELSKVANLKEVGSGLVINIS